MKEEEVDLKRCTLMMKKEILMKKTTRAALDASETCEVVIWSLILNTTVTVDMCGRKGIIRWWTLLVLFFQAQRKTKRTYSVRPCWLCSACGAKSPTSNLVMNLSRVCMMFLWRTHRIGRKWSYPASNIIMNVNMQPVEMTGATWT